MAFPAGIGRCADNRRRDAARSRDLEKAPFSPEDARTRCLPHIPRSCVNQASPCWYGPAQTWTRRRLESALHYVYLPLRRTERARRPGCRLHEVVHPETACDVLESEAVQTKIGAPDERPSERPHDNPGGPGGVPSMKTVVCCGAATLDTIFRVARLPAGPGKLLPDRDARGRARHGDAAPPPRWRGSAAAPALLARVGDDAAGARFVADLEAAGVDCAPVRRVGGRAHAALHRARRRRRRAAGHPLVRPRARPRHRLAAARRGRRGRRRARRRALARGRRGGPRRRPGRRASRGPRRRRRARRRPCSRSPRAPAMRSSPSRRRWRSPAPTRRSRRRSPRSRPGSTASSRSRPAPTGCHWLDRTAGAVRRLAPPAVAAVDTLAAGDVFHGAFALAPGRGRRRAARRSPSPTPPRR